MTPPAAPPRHPSPVESSPPAAIAAAVLAGLGALVLLCLAFLVLALGGLSSDGADRAWALLPLAAGLAAALGSVRLLRRRGWGALAAACLLAAAFVVLLVAQAADLGEDPPVGLAALLLAGPVLALALALTPPVRRWLASTS
jgi:peptidoglycan/LPS O-acetylase OafA/YrhL